MAQTKLRAARATGTALGNCFAITPSGSAHIASLPARQAPIGAVRLASTALAAVLDAADLDAAKAAARIGLDRIAAEAPCNILFVPEARELSGKSASQVRRWAAKHRLGRKQGGEWILRRDRFIAYLTEGAA